MSHKYLFYNFTDKPFTGYWNGKAYTFKPGVKKYYPRLIARHFAKHLTNEVLQTPDADGNTRERFTSPKKPDEVPVFMEVFKKAFLVEEVPDEDNLDIDQESEETDEPSMNINVKQREEVDPYNAAEAKAEGPAGPPQVIGGEDEDLSPEHVDEDDYKDTKDEKKGGDSEA